MADDIIEANCDVCEDRISPTPDGWVHIEDAEYDHNAVGPAQFTDPDREALEQLSEIQAMPCPGCGQPMDEQGFCNNIDCESRKI